MVNAQQYLEENYPKDLRNNTKELDISNKNLEDKLIIKDFPNLDKAYCLVWCFEDDKNYIEVVDCYRESNYERPTRKINHGKKN